MRSPWPGCPPFRCTLDPKPHPVQGLEDGFEHMLPFNWHRTRGDHSLSGMKPDARELLYSYTRSSDPSECKLNPNYPCFFKPGSSSSVVAPPRKSAETRDTR